MLENNSVEYHVHLQLIEKTLRFGPISHRNQTGAVKKSSQE